MSGSASRSPTVYSPHGTGRPISTIQGAVIIPYLSPLLAILVGIVHAALAPVIVVGGVKPNLVLSPSCSSRSSSACCPG